MDITVQAKKIKSDFEEKVTRLENETEVKSEKLKNLELEKLSDKENIQNIKSENNDLKNQLEQLNKQINTIKVKQKIVFFSWFIPRISAHAFVCIDHYRMI